MSHRFARRRHRWRPGPLGHYVRARLRRRIFVWFGVTIMLSGLVGASMVGLLSDSRGAWRDSVERATTFVGHRFGEVWNDPAARDHLARSAADELRLRIELRDTEGRSLARFGEECHGVAGEFSAPVEHEGRNVGRVDACLTTAPHGSGRAVALGIFAALAVLWGASGAIAWRLTRPLAQLVRVTRAIGEGDLTIRAALPRRAGEMSVLARSINEMAERIQRQLADQRELLAVVSHEIRTPLGHMRVLLDLARDGSDPATLDELETELLEVDRLVDRLLASSRLEFEQLDRRPLRADELAARALARAELPETLLDVRTDALDLEGDPTLLGRALANLVDNAQTHGGGLTRLQVYRDEDRLYFSAEDAGPGLPDGAGEQLFEKFVRAGEGGRLGLGLSLVQRIAQAHGGSAFAESPGGGGARVGFGIEPLPSPGSTSGDAES